MTNDEFTAKLKQYKTVIEYLEQMIVTPLQPFEIEAVLAEVKRLIGEDGK